MFSGIVERLGEVRAHGRDRLGVATPALQEGVRPGDSVSINGACLTVAAVTDDGFVADVMPETLARTTLGRLRPGDAVNIERALMFGDRLGGHLVTGHVDATGIVTSLRDDATARWVTIDAPHDVLPMIAEKGCIAVDGISLTVVDVFATAFTVSLIPYTLENTTAGTWTVGWHVNLEVDLIARYVQAALTSRQKAAPVRSFEMAATARRGVSEARVVPRAESRAASDAKGVADRVPGAVAAISSPERDRRRPSQEILEQKEVARR